MNSKDSTIRHSPTKFLDNPYLGSDEIEQKKPYRDAHGKEWTLEELAALQDFIKFKVDLFAHGTGGSLDRFPISLQIIQGFSWRGKNYFGHSEAVKGVPPLMRTAVYMDPVGYAVGGILSRGHALFETQKKDLVASSFQDIAALTAGKQYWSAKLLKKVYGLLHALNHSESNLGGVMVERIFDMINLPIERRNGFVLNFLISINNSVNQPALDWMNSLKRILNDLYEVSESNRLQHLDLLQMDSRLQELEHLLRIAEKNLPENNDLKRSLIKGFARLREKMQQWRTWIDRNDLNRAQKDILDAKTHSQMVELYSLVKDWEQILVRPVHEDHREFIRTLARYGVAMHRAYISDRSQDLGKIEPWSRGCFEVFEHRPNK